MYYKLQTINIELFCNMNMFNFHLDFEIVHENVYELYIDMYIKNIYI